MTGQQFAVGLNRSGLGPGELQLLPRLVQRADSQLLQQSLLLVPGMFGLARQRGQILTSGRNDQLADTGDVQLGFLQQQQLIAATQRLLIQAELLTGQQFIAQPRGDAVLAYIQLPQLVMQLLQPGQLLVIDPHRGQRLLLGDQFVLQLARLLQIELGLLLLLQQLLPLPFKRVVAGLLPRLALLLLGLLIGRQRSILRRHQLGLLPGELLQLLLQLPASALALLEVVGLFIVAAQLLQYYLPVVAHLLQRLQVTLLLLGLALDLGILVLGVLLLHTQGFPGPVGLIARLLLAQFTQPINLLAVGRDALIQRLQLFLQRCDALPAEFVVTAGFAGAGEQFVELGTNLSGNVVTTAAGHFTQAGAQYRFQVVAGMTDRLAQLLAHALLDPQQPGNTPMLGLAGAPGRNVEAEHGGELFLRFVTIEALAIDGEIAAFALQETLVQLPLPVGMGKAQLYLRRGTGIAPGPQIGERAGAVPLEKRRADGAHQGALAGFIGPADQVQPRAETINGKRFAELPELADTQLFELHAAVPPACRSRSRPARMASASRATSGSSLCCRSRSWPITSSR